MKPERMPFDLPDWIIAMKASGVPAAREWPDMRDPEPVKNPGEILDADGFKDDALPAAVGGKL